MSTFASTTFAAADASPFSSVVTGIGVTDILSSNPSPYTGSFRGQCYVNSTGAGTAKWAYTHSTGAPVDTSYTLDFPVWIARDPANITTNPVLFNIEDIARMQNASSGEGVFVRLLTGGTIGVVSNISGSPAAAYSTSAIPYGEWVYCRLVVFLSNTVGYMQLFTGADVDNLTKVAETGLGDTYGGNSDRVYVGAAYKANVDNRIVVFSGLIDWTDAASAFPPSSSRKTYYYRHINARRRSY